MSAPTTGQRFWQRFCRFAAQVFYSRFEVAGAENLPPTGPVILCANHANALVDPVLVQASCLRPVHPLARSGLFRNPLLRPLLRVLQAVPIYRRKESANDPGRNEDSFLRCYELLAEGAALLIFPEGQSHSDPQLRPLKTGAARLALGSYRRTGRWPALIPIGLTFSHKGRFRGSALVQIGEPLRDELAPTPGEDEEISVRRLTDGLGQGLQSVTLNVDSWEDLSLLRLLERFFALRRGRHPGRKRRRSLSQRFRSLQQLIASHRRLRLEQPAIVANLRERLSRFERRCRRYGLKDYHLQLHYRPMVVLRFVLRSLSFALLVFPIALVGVLGSALPYLATRATSRRVARGRDQYDTSSMLFGLLYFSLFWGGQTAFVFWRFGLWPAVICAAALPLTAAVALKVSRERRRILENLRIFFLFLRRRRLQRYLRAERQALEKQVAQVARLARTMADDQPAS